MSYQPGAEPNIGGMAGAGAGGEGPTWASPAIGVDTAAFRSGKKDVEGFGQALGQLFRQIDQFVGGKGKQFQDLISNYGKVGTQQAGGSFRSAFGHGSAPMPSGQSPWSQMQSSNEQNMAKVRTSVPGTRVVGASFLPGPGQGQLFGGTPPPQPFGTRFQQQAIFGAPAPTAYAVPGGTATPSLTDRMRQMTSDARQMMMASVGAMRSQMGRFAGPARSIGGIATAAGIDVAAANIYGAGMTYNSAAWQLADTTLNPTRAQPGIQATLGRLRGAQSPADAASAAQILQSTLGRPFNESPTNALRMADQLSAMTRYRMSETASAQAYSQEYQNRWNIAMFTGLRFGADNPPNVNTLAKTLAQRYGGLQGNMSPEERQRRIEAMTAPNSGFNTVLQRVIPGSPQLQQGVLESLQRYNQLGGQFYTGTSAQNKVLGIGKSPQEVQQQFTASVNQAKDALSTGLIPAFTDLLKAVKPEIDFFNKLNKDIPGFGKSLGIVIAGMSGLATVFAGGKLIQMLAGSIKELIAWITRDTIATEAETNAKAASAGGKGGGGLFGGGLSGIATSGAGGLGVAGTIGLYGGTALGGTTGASLGSKAVGGHGAPHFAAKTGGGIAGGAAVGAGLGLLGGPFDPITVPGGAIAGGIIGGLSSLFTGDTPTGHYFPAFSGVNPLSQKEAAAGDGPLPGPGRTAGMQQTIMSKLLPLFKANPKLVINSGYRSTQEQAALYAAYKSGRGALAAPPGRSMHEKGLAADLGPPSEYGWLEANAPKFGLIRTVVGPGGEMWHYEPAGARSGLGTAPGPVPDTGKGGASTPVSLDTMGFANADLLGKMSMMSGIVQALGAQRGGTGPAGGAAGGAAQTGGPNVNVGAGMGLVNVLKLAQGHGLHGTALQTAVAISGRESNWDPNQHNYNLKTGDDSYGLWQINMLGAMGPERRKMFGITSDAQLLDPNTNARAMMILSGGGTNWSPWSTYKNDSFAGLMSEVGAAMKQYNIGDAPMSGPGGAVATPTGPRISPVVINAPGASGSRSVHIGSVTIPLQFSQALTPRYVEMIVTQVKSALAGDRLLEAAGT